MRRLRQTTVLILSFATLLFGNKIEADECCETQPPKSCCCEERGLMDQDFAMQNNLWGIWLPEAPPLFRPFIADPRQVTYSVGWRYEKHLFNENIIPVSYGDILPIFRWVNIFQPGGQLDFGIEGALWAIFDPLHDSSPLVDADYYVGFPVSYSCGNWAFKLRGYHISTHIGDEFLLNHKHFHRKNPSIEAFDFFFSNQYSRNLRLYGGIGWVACQDDSYRVGRVYLQGGFEWRYFQWGYQDNCNRLYGVPFVALNLYYQSHFENNLNTTLAVGYEWGKESGLERRLRFFFEYHNGYAVEGQFSKHRSNYYAIRATYGY